MTDGKSRPDSKKLRLYRTILSAVVVLGILLAYSGFVMFRTAGLYDYVKTGGPGWRGGVHRADPELGLAPVSGTDGAQILPLGFEVPVRFDQDGFRVPVDDEDLLTGEGPVLMSLGCSFTYGAGVRARDTFIHLAADRMDGTAVNAGVCSYSLVQMMLLARRLVPEYRPDYLVVQFSPWLVGRAMTPFAPSYVGRLPVPYFFESDSTLMLHHPVFMSKSISLDIDRYRDTPKGFGDFLSFLWNIGIPLFVHDDVNVTIYTARRLFGDVPEPAGEAGRVVMSVYAEIAGVCEENGTRMVILVLGRTPAPVDVPYQLFPGDAIIVNGHAAMLDSLDECTEEEYYREYAIWRGDPPCLVDYHLSERAHEIVAMKLLEAI